MYEQDKIGINKVENLEQIKTGAIEAINNANDLDSLEKVRVDFFGKSGKVTDLMKSLGKLSPEEKKTKGQMFNSLRQDLMSKLQEKKNLLEEKALKEKLSSESVDMTLPIDFTKPGSVHPISQTIFEVTHILKGMGFAVAEGPHIEDDFHNFTALNIPPEHPARQEQDTFYLKPTDSNTKERKVLRTHTSPVQIRTMENNTPPIKIIAPGRTFRSDSDVTHTPTFHQIEGLYIDKDINMGHLKGVLLDFCRKFFEIEDLELRFRPSFFPFTEPSAEVDIGCSREKGKLSLGGNKDWLEVLGCGMVHPNVLRNCGIDPDEYQGFAFGMGIERLAMLKQEIPDLRSFYEADERWLAHYGFSFASALLAND